MPTLQFRGLLSSDKTILEFPDAIKGLLAALIHPALLSLDSNAELSLPEVYSLITRPPQIDLGDLCFPCFSLAKTLRQSPAKIAESLANLLHQADERWNAKATGPYVNVSVPVEHAINTVLSPIGDGTFFDAKLVVNAEKTMIEYSQPNTHKELHVGHMRNLCFGQTLVHCLTYVGIPVVTATFPGDVGTHVAKCLWYMKNYNTDPLPNQNKGAWLGSLYSKSVQQFDAESDTDKREENQKQLSEILRQIETQSGEYYDLWKETREWSIEQFEEVYAWANVTFDVWYWESEVDSDSVALIKKLHQEGKVVESQGALGVDLEEQGLGFCLLLKADGNGLYATKDVMLAQRKIANFAVEKNIVIVDLRQAHHFKQVFAALDHFGFPQAKNCFHLPYNFVELPDGAMSSRKGNIIPIQTLIEQMEQTIIERYLQQFVETWGEQEITSTASMIAQGCIKFGMNAVDPATKIVFNLDEWLRLDGQSGPYVQYTCARIKSVLRKADEGATFQFSTNVFKEEEERQLILRLSDFNTVIVQVAETLRTNLLCSYLIEVCRAYNRFYTVCHVLVDDNSEVRQARLSLCKATLLVLEQGLQLLGISAPERM